MKYFIAALLAATMALFLWEASAGRWDTEEWTFPVMEQGIVVHVWSPERIQEFLIESNGEPKPGWTYVGAQEMIWSQEERRHVCHVYVPPLDGSERATEIWRHEFRHCMGWQHPEFPDIPTTHEEGLRIRIRPGPPKLRLPPEDAIPGQY